MNKTELVNAAAKRTALTIKETDEALNAILAVMEEALMAEEKVQITGFGTFEIKKHEARMGRNPRTGTQIAISASRNAAFTPSLVLKKKLNNK
ncbi:MAG: HU family DNA-binding protein [Clostridia bacterium]|nr:HU family DNA-binding protein [Clostridia bacterium]